MFISRYIPVNLKRTNEAVYTATKKFPKRLLAKAEEFLKDGKEDEDIIFSENTISFKSNPDIQWTVPEVYLAVEALSVANDKNFGFYTVTDKSGKPQLFVSKAFKKHRVLVCAYTFQSVIVTRPELLRRIASMIDNSYEFNYCINMFKTVSALEENRGKYLDALILDRGLEDETMVVNPLTSMYAEDNIYYSKDLIEEYRRVLSGEEETENLRVKLTKIERKNQPYYKPIHIDHAREFVEKYDKITSVKNDYVTLMDSNFEEQFYVSTNLRYLVNAKTLEVRVVKNTYIKNQLLSFASKGNSSYYEMMLCWNLLGIVG